MDRFREQKGVMVGQKRARTLIDRECQESNMMDKIREV